MLDQINSKVVSNLNINEWKNTKTVIKCFENINNKNISKIFDIKDFCPSIKEILLNEAI